MKIELYADSRVILKEFSFLVDRLGFSVDETKDLYYGTVVYLSKGNIVIDLYFEYKDYFFKFQIYDSRDKNPAREYYVDDLLQKYSVTDITTKDLQPNLTDGYEKALKLNSYILEKYGEKILNGEEWF